MNKEIDKLIAKSAREKGFEYTAQYIEAFGFNALNPAFIKGFDSKSEAFYKKCVEAGHSYDWFFEFPEDSTF